MKKQKSILYKLSGYMIPSNGIGGATWRNIEIKTNEILSLKGTRRISLAMKV